MLKVLTADKGYLSPSLWRALALKVSTTHTWLNFERVPDEKRKADPLALHPEKANSTLVWLVLRLRLKGH